MRTWAEIISAIVIAVLSYKLGVFWSAWTATVMMEAARRQVEEAGGKWPRDIQVDSDKVVAQVIGFLAWKLRHPLSKGRIR